MNAQAVVSDAVADLRDQIIRASQSERHNSFDADSDVRVSLNVRGLQARDAVAGQQRAVGGLVADAVQVDALVAHVQQDVGEAGVSGGRDDHQGGAAVHDGLSALEHVAV